MLLDLNLDPFNCEVEKANPGFNLGPFRRSGLIPFFCGGRPGEPPRLGHRRGRRFQRGRMPGYCLEKSGNRGYCGLVHAGEYAGCRAGRLRQRPSPAWDVVGVADFNGDGSPDILLRNGSTGDVLLWYMNGASVIGQDTVARLGSPWNIVGVGDFNGDGSPDILWRNPATGETVVWYMKGRLRLGAETMEALPPPWNIVEIGDFDGDGSPDILWKNSATGEVVVWYMHGLVHLDPGTIAVRAPPLETAGVCNLNAEVGPGINRRHIATLSDFCPRPATGLPGNIAIFSLCIRAPPTLIICS